MTAKTLSEVAAVHPFTEYRQWWPMGKTFLRFMSEAIAAEWRMLRCNSGDLAAVNAYVKLYIQTVYEKQPREALADDFMHQRLESAVFSGEFDALSYALYRDAFELIARHGARYPNPLERERRLFTKRVGRRFFDSLARHLALDLPHDLDTNADIESLKTNIHKVGRFLTEQGYLRDDFDFTFMVHVQHGKRQIDQGEHDLIARLHCDRLAYALYTMGTPVILPSAVYLYHTLGEAQHHSSRTIEELFDRVAYVARETDDFDPGEHPAEKVVELWEIRPKAAQNA